LGVLDEKRTHPNTNIGRSKWDFGPTSVIPCHNCFGALAYVDTNGVLKVKLLSVPKGFSPHVEFIPECFGTVKFQYPKKKYISEEGKQLILLEL
jgi:hypothetical protein